MSRMLRFTLICYCYKRIKPKISLHGVTTISVTLLSTYINIRVIIMCSVIHPSIRQLSRNSLQLRSLMSRAFAVHFIYAVTASVHFVKAYVYTSDGAD
jgi:hypothetical protein